MMKKLLFCALAALAFVACNKDDNKDNTPVNQIVVGGDRYDIAHAQMEYFGPNENEQTENVDLVFFDEDGSNVWFEMNVALGNETLVAGTYTYDEENYGNFKISYGEVYDITIDDGLEITGGTVKVAVSGDTYTITVNCTAEGNVKVTGNYTGKLKWFDESEE